MNKENYTRIQSGLYIVRTQAGFKQAFRGCTCATSPEEFQKELDRLEGYPKSYPSLVAFSKEYRGYHYTVANCVAINTVLEAIKESEGTLIDNQL